MSTYHSKKAKEFLKDPKKVERHDHTFWSLRQKGDAAAAELSEWEDLCEHASQIKEHTATHLADYLEQFTNSLGRNGVIIHFAKDAREFNEMIYGMLGSHKVKKLVKSKSMLTEECEMNLYLIKRGVNVAESDLGKRILQLMHLKSAHIVMPVIRLTRDEIGEAFEERGVSKEKGNHDPTYLTCCARKDSRGDSMDADAGLTGCNFGVAATGDCVVCTNEGNADTSTSVPKLHIVAMDIEKVIPDYDSLAVFQRLLARNGTGQPSAASISQFRKARPGGEVHVILVDNERSDTIANKGHWMTLKRTRYGVYMNTCPVYRRSGGYSYSYFIPGPIGADLGMLKSPKQHNGNVSVCSLYLSCDCVCPAKVTPGSQIYRWRQSFEEYGTENKEKKVMAEGMKVIYENCHTYDALLRSSSAANHIPESLMDIKLNPWSIGHTMPKFAKKPFHVIFKHTMEELKHE